MKISIDGIGLWAPGCTNWKAFSEGMASGFADRDLNLPPPQSGSIPPRERRRAPLTVKLAVEVIHQAAEMAAIDESELCSVFASATGDSHITDYICRTLASNEKTLSPTRFHNSVHNAPSGYWSIAAGNRLPSTFVSGFRNSLSAALLESCAVAVAEQRPTVLVIYDVAFGQPLFDACPTREDFAAALIVSPAAKNSRWTLDIDISPTPADMPSSSLPYLQERTARNPSATALLLFEFLQQKNDALQSWPLADADGAGSLIVRKI
jgi:hypothetical protein